MLEECFTTIQKYILSSTFIRLCDAARKLHAAPEAERGEAGTAGEQTPTDTRVCQPSRANHSQTIPSESTNTPRTERPEENGQRELKE